MREGVWELRQSRELRFNGAGVTDINVPRTAPRLLHLLGTTSRRSAVARRAPPPNEGGS
jgi:hypothetical protein